MAVKVGNSWVSEAALSYAKVKADSGESATLNGLLDRYPGAMDWAPAGSHVKAAGTIINANGSVSGWAITEDDNGDESREKTKLDKDKRDTWEKKILEMHKQKRIKEKKEAQKRLEKKSIDLYPTLSCDINVTA